MNYLKIAPISLDAVIQKLQVFLYDKLVDKWSVSLDGYGRCYPVFNSDTNKKEIQYFKSKNDYVNLVVAEQNKFFFTADDTINRVANNGYKTKINLYFIVDVKKIKDTIQHRADEEVRVDVLSILEKQSFATINNVVIEIDRVFNRYGYTNNNYNTSNWDDMQPFHCFRIELDTMVYGLDTQICNL